MPRVFLHLSHVSMYRRRSKAEWLNVEARFPAEFEVDPFLTDEQLHELSRQRFEEDRARVMDAIAGGIAIAEPMETLP